MTDTTKIAIFKGKSIRRTIYRNEWWFSVVDIVEALTDSDNPRDYWYKMKIRVKNEDSAELSTFCRQLKLKAPGGKLNVYLDETFVKTVTVDEDKLYDLIDLPTPGEHILKLEFLDANFELYAFTFG